MPTWTALKAVALLEFPSGCAAEAVSIAGSPACKVALEIASGRNGMKYFMFLPLFVGLVSGIRRLQYNGWLGKLGAGVRVFKFVASGDGTALIDDMRILNVPPPPPTEAAAIAEDGKVALFWNPSPGGASYTVYRTEVAFARFEPIAANLETRTWFFRDRCRDVE